MSLERRNAMKITAGVIIGGGAGLFALTSAVHMMRVGHNKYFDNTYMTAVNAGIKINSTNSRHRCYREDSSRLN